MISYTLFRPYDDLMIYLYVDSFDEAIWVWSHTYLMK